MLLKDFLQQLAMGPVGDLSVGGEGAGAIPGTQVPRMVLHLNSALTDLHTRFCLRRETLSLTTLSSRNRYPLLAKHALLSGSTEADKFILDTVAKPFLGDVLGIEAVLDANQCPLNLNVSGDQYGWHTVQFNTLSMGYPVSGELYTVQYRQKHPVILPAANVDTTEIQLPPSLEAALVAKVGQYVYGAMTSESAVLKANELMQLYDQYCMAADVTNVTNTSETDVRHDRFVRDGWV